MLLHTLLSLCVKNRSYACWSASATSEEFYPLRVFTSPSIKYEDRLMSTFGTLFSIVPSLSVKFLLLSINYFKEPIIVNYNLIWNILRNYTITSISTNNKS